MKIIFVYNARSGSQYRVIDLVHKLISPDTYRCELCKITHGSFQEKKEWRNFRLNSGLEMVFYYCDEFEQHYQQTFEYPVILLEEKDTLRPILEKSRLAKLNSHQDLILLLKERIASHRQTIQ